MHDNVAPLVLREPPVQLGVHLNLATDQPIGSVMSWVDKELKRRKNTAVRDTEPGLPLHAPREPVDPVKKLSSLWQRLETLNDALPPALRLRREVRQPGKFVGTGPAFPVALVASNGACVGLTDEGIRYIWPEKATRKSNNFWIRWKADVGFVINRRIGGSPAGTINDENKFNEDSVEHIIKCLVTNVRVKSKSLHTGKFLFIWRRY